MHVALIFSEERLLHEHFMLNRLAIGLIAEGLRVTRIVPELMSWEHVLLGEKRIALAPRLEAEMQVLPWLRHGRARKLEAELQKSPPDVIYAVGQKAWQVGIDLAKVIDCPLAINVWNTSLVRHVPGERSAHPIGAYIVPTKAMRNALSQVIDPELIRTVPMGIAIPANPQPIFQAPEDNISIAIIGGGRDIPAYRGMLGGLSKINREFPSLKIFLELRGTGHHEIWKYAQKLKLMDRISCISDASPNRQLLTQCDMMLLPERYGELYSIVLEAMANGMVVIASHDPMLDMLKPEETARRVEETTPEDWANQIRRTIQDPQASHNLGRQAREWVQEHHNTNSQVDSLIDALDCVVTGGTYSFAEAANTASKS